MGGLAFASGPNPLFTPRMPSAVYEAVKRHCHEVLIQHFTHVGTPIEAPGKNDYGDVDFLVACPTPLFSGPNTAAALSAVLGAERSIAGKGSSTISLALPWPSDTDAVSTDPANAVTATANAQKYVQVDIHICASSHDWTWMLFHHAHGDLWNMLGSTIRPLGLTANTSGLHLRIEEIETIDKKKSMVFLTSSPAEVLSFLGLDEAQWNRRFESAWDLYEYVAGCRYFWAVEKDEDEDEDDERINRNIEEEKRALKHNDRKRMNHRPVFRGWVEEFLPACRASGAYSREVAPSREQVRADAFERFSEVREEYEQRLETWRKERQVELVWRDVVKAGVPKEDVDFGVRAAAIRGLKAIVIEGDMSGGVVPEKALKNADGFYDVDTVAEFVQDNWRRVGVIQLERQNARAVEKMEQKRKEKNAKIG